MSAPAAPVGDSSPDKLPRLVRGVVIALIMGAALVSRLMLFVGIKRLDSFRYLEISHHVLSGGSLFDTGIIYGARRLAMMLPLILSNRIAGYGEHVSVAWPLLCSLGTVLVVYLLGKELWNWRVGALAAFAMALYPLEVELGTQLLPDPIAGLFIALAVYLAVLAVRRDKGSIAYAIAAGASLGVVFYTRENALIFLPGLMAVGLLLNPKRWTRTLWTPLGVAAVVAAAALYFWIAFGNPVIDWVRFREFYLSYRSGGFIQPTSSYVHDFLTRPAFAAFPVTIVLAAVGTAFSKGRGRWVLFTWAAGFLVMLTVIGPIVGMDVSYRYAEPVIPPLLLLASAGVAVLGSRVNAEGRVLLAAALAVVLFLPSARSTVRAQVNNARWAGIEKAWHVVERLPGSYVFVDHAWVFTVLNYDSRYTLGRDSLAPADAAVNKDARLFKIGERSIPAIQPGFLVVVSDPPSGVRVQQKAEYWFESGKTLRVFEFGPQAGP